LGRDPAKTAAALDTVIAASQGPRPAIRRLQAFVARARARLALGDTEGATDDLGLAVTLLDEQRAGLASAPLRASLLDAARAVFDQVVMLRVAAGDTAGALAYLEKGRASLTHLGAAGSAASRLRMPAQQVAVTYALIGDTLLAWTLRGDAVRLNRTTINRDKLIRRIERVRSALEVRAGEQAVRADLEALYDALLRPVSAPFGTEGTEIVVVADGEIAAVPFAALRDSVRRRYLVELHPSSFAGTLRDALPSTEVGGAKGGVLLVADPAFEQRAHPALGRLQGAQAEVTSLASDVYPGAAVLSGAAATREAVTQGLAGARIIHFAGHAAFDDARPERSHLVLARGGAGGGVLTAAALAEMELGHVRLIVLSACQTLRAGSGRSGGFAGFAAALFGAGVGGMLGSLWRIDDQHARSVMDAFHRRYQLHEDGPRALREAQLQMLQSPDPALRSPAAWAGYRYAGH
jgi:CHAT domain-containing protein